jgi:sulfite reductase beta subunit-like hemoprotein
LPPSIFYSLRRTEKEIRNIMSSPTAGIDSQALVETRPLVREWNRTLMSRPDFAVLSPKFSVCFGGGEAVTVGDRLLAEAKTSLPKAFEDLI